MTGNRNPLHYDKAAVTALAFGEIIVPDGVTSGILNAVAAEDLPVRCKSYSFNVDLSFRSPVRPGDFAPGIIFSKCAKIQLSRCGRRSSARTGQWYKPAIAMARATHTSLLSTSISLPTRPFTAKRARIAI